VGDAEDAPVDWPPSWTRASLELAVLALVCAHGPTHGYDVARRLRDAGLGEVKGGTLYPVLGRLEEQVREICRQLDQGVSPRIIGFSFGVDAKSIRNIDQGKTWCHLPE